jgi:hypothetical protein
LQLFIELLIDRAARSRDVLIIGDQRLLTKSASTRLSLSFATCCKFEKILWNALR